MWSCLQLNSTRLDQQQNVQNLQNSPVPVGISRVQLSWVVRMIRAPDRIQLDWLSELSRIGRCEQAFRESYSSIENSWFSYMGISCSVVSDLPDIFLKDLTCKEWGWIPFNVNYPPWPEILCISLQIKCSAKLQSPYNRNKNCTKN